MYEYLESKFLWITLVFTVFYVSIRYYVYGYWASHKVPHDSPSILFGNVPVSYFLGRIPLGNLIRESHDKFMQHAFHGFYVLFRPVMIVNDPELIRTILVKEFHRFCDRGWFADEKIDPMSNNLFLQSEKEWRRLRSKFSPTFTPGKLRQIYPLMKEISDKMVKVCNEDLEESRDLEIKDIIARYTTDIISSTVYGYNCNSLENPNNEFRRYGMRAFEFGRINMLIAVFLPEILENVTLPFYHKEVRDFFAKTFIETMEHRRREKIVRKDFLNLLMQLVDSGKVEDDDNSTKSIEQTKENVDRITLSDAAAQAFVFFLAGFETSSATVTYCLLELAMNPYIQEKLQEEIDELVESPDGLTFDALMQSEYLDMVFSETLRKYPNVAFLNRICMEDFPIPGTNYVIPKGMRIVISPPGVHHNPSLYPDPDKFDPSRFAKDNSTSKVNSINLTFGEGPRNCIGKRFGILQSKQAIVSMLYNYSFSVSDKMKFPIKYVTESFVQSPEDGVYLHFEKRKR